MSGVVIGRVAALRRQGNCAIATVEIDDQYAPVRSGAKAIVRAKTLLGEGYLELAPGPSTAPTPEALDFVEGAGLIVNYHTAYFALVTRGRLKAGETVLVHGAAGGVGTATLQVAKALRARTVAVVSDDEKERFAREAGADEVLRSTGPWRDEAKELSGGGVDVVIDPVGGERFTDSLRSLRRCGRLVAVGFSGGEIPAVKVNRLLLNNTEVVGAAWGEYALGDPDGAREIGREVNRLVDDGFVRPLIGQRFALDQAAEALKVIERRQALGKIVLDVR